MSDETLNNAHAILQSYAQRMDRLMQEKEDAMEALKELKLEIKSHGHDVQALTRMVKFKRNEKALAREREMRDFEGLYSPAIGLEI